MQANIDEQMCHNGSAYLHHILRVFARPLFKVTAVLEPSQLVIYRHYS